MKNIFAVFLIAALLLLSGCTQPTGLVGDPYSDEPVPHKPRSTVEVWQGSPGEPRQPGWAVWVRVATPTLPATDAVLNLTLTVEGGPPGTEPFEGDDWIFRLNLKNGTLKVPPESEWFRSYTLQGEIDKNIKHHTSFPLGELISDRVFLRMTYHKIQDDGKWEAWEATFHLKKDGKEYSAYSDSRNVCRSGGISPCPWSGQNGTVSPPPPDNW